MQKHRVTIKDLAKALNISTSTVSRALRDHPEINADTRKAVLELAAAMDYQPNLVSLSLLNQKTNTIGVIVPKMGYHFFSHALDGIESILAPKGYTVMVCQTNERYEKEVDTVNNLAAGRVDGFLISVSGKTSQYGHLDTAKRRGLPVVLFDRTFEGYQSSQVIIDNYKAAKAAVQHLIDIGCRKIAYLGGPETLALSNTRLKGYLDILQEYQLLVDPARIRHCDVSWEGAVAAARTLLEHPERPDAIFAMSDRFAFAVMAVCKQKGFQIPEDVAVIGFNNDAVGELTTPSLSTISQNSFNMGEVAARLLLRELESKEPFQPETIILPTELVIRESTMKVKK
jgi:DNA-binding LacI/PurR family transcriptional regulator